MARLPIFIAAGVLFVVVAVAAILLVSRDEDAARPGRSSRSQNAQVDAPDLAADRSALDDLRIALLTAKTHYTTGSTYEGLDVELARSIEPGLSWYANEPAHVGGVTINLATDDDVIMSTVSESGQVFCVSERDEGPDSGWYQGRMDGFELTDATACSGGW